MREAPAHNRRALVTGASRGIGRAMAQALAADGYDVIGTCHPGSLSASQRGDGVRFMPLDLQDIPSIDALARAAGPIDVLVNNAGASQIGPGEEVELERMRRLFDANLFGAIRLTQAVLPGMRERRAGTVVAVASFAALAPVPFLSVYAATKAALIAFFRGLRHEVAPWAIRVAVLAPFDISTSIPLDIGYTEGSAYLPTVARVREARDRFLAEAPGPEIVAKALLRLLRAGRPRFLTTVGESAGLRSFLVKHLPDAIVERVIRRRFGLP